MALHEDGDLAVAGDDDLAAAPPDGAHDLAGGALGRHDQPRGDRLSRRGLQAAAVVHAADLRLDEARADERHRHAGRRQLVAEGLGERAHRELAHRVRRRAGRGDVAGDAADDRQPPPRGLQLAERRLHGAQHPEDVGFELAAIVREGQLLDRADDAEAGVGDDDVESSEGGARLGHHALDVAVNGDVAGQRQGAPPVALELAGQGRQALAPAGHQDEGRTAAGELAGQRGPDAGRGARDQHDVARGRRHLRGSAA